MKKQFMEFVNNFTNPSGSGGGEAVLVEKTITENGEYLASDDSADGYSKIVAQISSGNPPYLWTVTARNNKNNTIRVYGTYDESEQKVRATVLKTNDTTTFKVVAPYNTSLNSGAFIRITKINGFPDSDVALSGISFQCSDNSYMWCAVQEDNASLTIG